MRRFILGDCHGSYRALLQVINRSGFDFKKDELISLGDIVDGWSESYECVELLLKCKHLIAVKGNHDDWFLQYINRGLHPVMNDTTTRYEGEWGQGAEATKQSYIRNYNQLNPTNKEYFLNTSMVPESHKKFFKEQILYMFDDKTNQLFVHGGIERGQTLRFIQQTRSFLFYWDRHMWTAALSAASGGQSLRFIEQFKEIFIGHTATINWKDRFGQPITDPMKAERVWNLDTGAGFKGKLTMMELKEDGEHEMFQSDLVHDLYPDEAGRRL